MENIPKYGLYGETPSPEEPGFLYIKPLPSGVAPGGWLIKPHIHTELIQVIYVLNGQCRVSLDERNEELSGKWFTLIPPHTVHEFRFQPNTTGYVLSISNDLFTDEDLRGSGLSQDLINTAPVAQQLSASENSWAIEQTLGLLMHHQKTKVNGTEMILRDLTKVFLVSLFKDINKSAQGPNTSTYSRAKIEKFRSLVEQNYPDHWPVNRYASELSLSPATLNRFCRRHLDRSAKTVIQERVLLESKRRLIYTGESVDYIALSLGFKEPSYFWRFFKKQTQQTPNSYRLSKRVKTGTAP